MRQSTANVRDNGDTPEASIWKNLTAYPIVQNNEAWELSGRNAGTDNIVEVEWISGTFYWFTASISAPLLKTKAGRGQVESNFQCWSQWHAAWKDLSIKEAEKLKGLTSLRGSPCDIWSSISFCSSLRAPIDCWFLAKSESSLSPASLKYLEKYSLLRLLAGNSSWKRVKRPERNWIQPDGIGYQKPCMHCFSDDGMSQQFTTSNIKFFFFKHPIEDCKGSLWIFS